MHGGRDEDEIGGHRGHPGPEDGRGILTRSARQPGQHRQERETEEQHHGPARDLTPEADGVGEEEAESDVEVLGAPEVLGQEAQHGDPRSRQIREIAGGHHRPAGQREAPLPAPPPGEEQHRGVELHRHRHTERESRQRHASFLPAEQREQNEREHREVHVAGLSTLEDGERRPRVHDDGRGGRAAPAEQHQEQRRRGDLAGDDEQTPGDDAVGHQAEDHAVERFHARRVDRALGRSVDLRMNLGIAEGSKLLRGRRVAVGIDPRPLDAAVPQVAVDVGGEHDGRRDQDEAEDEAAAEDDAEEDAVGSAPAEHEPHGREIEHEEADEQDDIGGQSLGALPGNPPKAQRIAEEAQQPDPGDRRTNRRASRHPRRLRPHPQGTVGL